MDLQGKIKYIFSNEKQTHGTSPYLFSVLYVLVDNKSMGHELA